MLVLIVVVFVVAGAAAWWRLEFAHPAQLWLTVWSIALGLFALHLLPYAQIADETLLWIAVASIAFVGAALVASRLPALRSPSRIGAQQVEWAAALVLVTALAGCALFVAQAALDAGLRNALFTSQAVRQAVQDGAYAVTIKYLYFAIAAAAMCSVAAGVVSERRWRWIAGAGAAVACTYFATGRSTVVVAGIAASVGFLLAAAPRLGLRRLVLAAGGAALMSLAIFMAMGQLIGKTYENSDLGSVRSFFTEHPRAEALATPYMYASAPIGALNVLLRRPPEDKSDGCAMFSSVCSALSHAGLDTRPVPPIRPFTANPIPWNTYTALDDVIRDVGVTGVPIIFGMLGLVCGWLFAVARGGRPWAIAGYAVLSTAIITSPGANTFAAAHIIGAITIMLVSLRVAMVVSILVSRR
jgi:oligosaccharide repeat unit polymerase